MSRSVRDPKPVDIHVGSRVRLRRTLLGMTQTTLGEAIGLTFQQVQKYERGVNRIGSSRLYDLARVLDVPVSFFFDDMPTKVAEQTPAQKYGNVVPLAGFDSGLMVRREALELMRAYYKIPDARVRKRLSELVKSLAAASDD